MKRSLVRVSRLSPRYKVLILFLLITLVLPAGIAIAAGPDHSVVLTQGTGDDDDDDDDAGPSGDDDSGPSDDDDAGPSDDDDSGPSDDDDSGPSDDDDSGPSDDDDSGPSDDDDSGPSDDDDSGPSGDDDSGPSDDDDAGQSDDDDSGPTLLGSPGGPGSDDDDDDDGKTIWAKALTSHECNDSEWHFVITQIDGESMAPGSITVTWENAGPVDIPLDKFTGKTAHYATDMYLDQPVTSAYTSIYGSWDGQFNLSHGPCEFGDDDDDTGDDDDDTGDDDVVPGDPYLEFTAGCSGNCGEIWAEVCNTGTGDMTQASTWEILYDEGYNPWAGEVAGSGTIGPLAAGECQKLYFTPFALPYVQYKFQAYQIDGSLIWAENVCELVCVWGDDDTGDDDVVTDDDDDPGDDDDVVPGDDDDTGGDDDDDTGPEPTPVVTTEGVVLPLLGPEATQVVLPYLGAQPVEAVAPAAGGLGPNPTLLGAIGMGLLGFLRLAWALWQRR